MNKELYCYDEGIAYNTSNFDEEDILDDYFCEGCCDDCWNDTCKLRDDDI